MHFSATSELPSNFLARLKLYGIDKASCACLASLWPVTEPALHAGLAGFLAWERDNPAVSALFQLHGDEIVRLEAAHLSVVLAGRIDETYVVSCRRTAGEHERLGLNARTRLFARNMIYREVLAALGRRHPIRTARMAALATIVANVLDFDLAVTMTAQLDITVRSSEERRALVETAIGEFEPAIRSVADAVTCASDALRVSSADMRGVADETMGRMRSAARVFGDIAANIDDTAAATEQLAQSIAEIGSQSDGSLRLAQSAEENARRSMTSLDDLSGAVQQIGSVVELISTIAAQTNLLALNATIEAARAGEAGRGFAVVAAEVKALAGQTAKATGDIARQIAAIQDATGRSVDHIGGVAKIVSNIAAAATAIAASVEEQGAATRSISEGIRRMAETTSGASQDIGAVETASGRTLAAAETIVGWTERLSGGAGALDAGVQQFFARVRGTG